MSLSDDAVFSRLHGDFVVGWKNIARADHVGYSRGYAKRDSAIATTNGAGAHNLQIFVLAPDLTVLHALAGYWHPEDLSHELDFAKALWRLWRDDERSLEQKRDLCRRLQLHEARSARWARGGRNAWQPFDAAEEHQRVQREPRDTFALLAGGGRRLKAPAVVLHERMAERPFVKLKDFDIASFVDHGTYHYDLNGRIDEGGAQFPYQERLMAKRERAERAPAKAGG